MRGWVATRAGASPLRGGPGGKRRRARVARGGASGWACWWEYVIKGVTPTEPTIDNTFTCHGSGGYEGLTAVLVSTPTVGFAAEFVGLISSGDLPPAPEPPAAQ